MAGLVTFLDPAMRHGRAWCAWDDSVSKILYTCNTSQASLEPVGYILKQARLKLITEGAHGLGAQEAHDLG
jgi:hypothetical protein